ncbi:hypothetical protein PG999_007837 [Apiospora kogelbergensis]|uniref:Inositolphosphotransferase Aur1/Ipt1 domain-containing protein n=1 Tax=Apiospora kogelbergensis TaxID=1337665 RepID=A0AAW0QSA5_9PEZI
MGVGGLAEPVVVVSLLAGGVIFNRNTNYKLFAKRGETPWKEKADDDEVRSSRTSSSDETAVEDDDPYSPWRQTACLKTAISHHQRQQSQCGGGESFLSRLLIKFPFLCEVWYWALIYWVYQLGRAVSALTLVEGTVNVARRHGLQVVHLEQQLGIFLEPAIQKLFLPHTTLMPWINRLYSFIHIPATIFFLVCLYYYCIVRNRVNERQEGKEVGQTAGSPAGAPLFQARRRTMAMCNLIAFIIFTLWPCMPPRLLSDPNATGDDATEGRTYGFVDTVHGADGDASYWTQNKFCNQYAAMPSLHFGYSLMIGMTVGTLPLSARHRLSRTVTISNLRFRLPSTPRILCLLFGFFYPFIILVAIVSTANHFILDAVAGALVCAVAWNGNKFMLNLLPLEDYFLWCVRINKPRSAS